MRFITALAILLTAPATGACGGGGDDLEIVLPFVGNVMAKGKAGEENMASRGSLVLPPAVRGLPAPTDKKQAKTGDAGWPVDPDEKAASDAELAAIEDKKYRRDGDWKNKRSSGNGIEDFNDKIDWSRRQKGVLQDRLNKPEYRK